MSAVAVVGAGIVGASVAYHLARRGVSVTLIDQAASPAAGVTGDSFAWIGDSGGDWPGGAEDLRGSVLTDYRRLEAELPGTAVRWTGSLAWSDGGEGFRPGRGQEWVGRSEIAALEPHLQSPPERAVYSPADGGVDPLRLTETLVQAARRLGAQVMLGSGVTSLEIAGGRVEGVMTSTGFHPASTVVLAAGTGVPALCEPLGVHLPVAVSPAFLIRVEAPSRLVRTILAGPHFEARELRDGRLLMTAPHAGATSGAVLRRLAEHTVERLRSAFGGDVAVRLLGHRLGRRPMPPDGPIVGYVTPDRSVYVAVMHAAVTLAPTVGRLVADELVTGQPAAELRRCRPRGGSSSPPAGSNP
ncbi:NAD(P)/FAD-dependent oxidoreductase [Nonomuraea sp. SYSU D8015]|uniref:NAD(P)/FAD-dependent oxidoreductase n=1 Tax=Nonomuraea sp. SYSU D8015 TaxID=2593644 RepID=UPI001660BAEA|nr:FAD-dependent oxidoreductase [Nonomuraea sp. SYSU D8015]